MGHRQEISRKNKLIARLLSRPKDFSWSELTALLKQLGYREEKTGKTGGPRLAFVHDTAAAVLLHQPHPSNELKRYAVDQVIETLQQEGLP